MKKLIIVAVVIFAFALTMNVAFASVYGGGSTAITKTIVKSNANTGGNAIDLNIASTTTSDNHDFWHPVTTCTTCGTNTIGTGSASSSVANVSTGVTVGGTSLWGMGGGTSKAVTKTVVVSNANSGNNEIIGNIGGTNTISTGGASSSISMVSTGVTVK